MFSISLLWSFHYKLQSLKRTYFWGVKKSRSNHFKMKTQTSARRFNEEHDLIPQTATVFTSVCVCVCRHLTYICDRYEFHITRVSASWTTQTKLKPKWAGPSLYTDALLYLFDLRHRIIQKHTTDQVNIKHKAFSFWLTQNIHSENKCKTARVWFVKSKRSYISYNTQCDSYSILLLLWCHRSQLRPHWDLMNNNH